MNCFHDLLVLLYFEHTFDPNHGVFSVVMAHRSRNLHARTTNRRDGDDGAMDAIQPSIHIHGDRASPRDCNTGDIHRSRVNRMGRTRKYQYNTRMIGMGVVTMDPSENTDNH